MDESAIIWELVRKMSAHNIIELEIQQPGVDLYIRLSAADADRTATGDAIFQSYPGVQTESSGDCEVLSPEIGYFRLSHPLRESNCVITGQRVKQGDVLAFVHSGNIVYPVVSPILGEFDRALVLDGQMVEFGQPVACVKAL